MSKQELTSAEEIVLSDDDLLISKTDSNGTIIYGNRDFIRYSGFEEAELLGQSHATLRHPDMPAAIFKLMNNNLQASREFFGFIKYVSKNGNYYWTYSNVSPTYDAEGVLVGYFSVERKSYPSAINYFSDIYHSMLKKECHDDGNDDQKMDSSMEVLFDAIRKAGGSGYDEFMFSG